MDEEKLRKIHDIISKRINDNEVKYSIFRDDSFSFETKKLEDIVNQENSKLSKINEIRIKLDKTESLDLSLGFDDSGVNLYIEGENRDNVFLLFSELKEYISNEVCTQRLTSKNLNRYMLYFFVTSGIIFVISFIIILINTPKISNEVINNILQSNDTNEKLNLLIKDNFKEKFVGKDYSIFYQFLFFPIAAVIFIFSEQLFKVISFFFPANLFLFGKEYERYNKYLEIRSKIFWVIVLGLLISIIGSLIVWRVTLQR